MKGFSGQEAYRSGNEFIKKTDGDPKRLLHQAWKQQKYAKRMVKTEFYNTFDVPKVTGMLRDGFKMKYIDGKNIIEIMKEEPERLPSIADSILRLIDWEFKYSVNRLFRLKPLIQKLSPVCPKELSCYTINEAKKIRWKLIPYGMNHGDLTMANMIFTKDRIYLIDFLKTFLRTPYQDIAKLLQEIDLHWSSLMSDYSKEGNAIKYGYDYLNWRIQKHLKENYLRHKQAIRVFHLACLCRLFPYCKDNYEVFNLTRYRCMEIIDDEDLF